MPAYSSKRLVTFTPRQMFDVVADVERYPEFLPLCESLQVTHRETHLAKTVLVATMGVGYKSMRERFTSRVTLKADEPAIDVSYLDGPFHHLENRWRFLPAQQGCEIDFYIDYAFRSRMLAVLMGSMFDSAFRRFAQAFDERAQLVYGPAETQSAPNT